MAVNWIVEAFVEPLISGRGLDNKMFSKVRYMPVKGGGVTKHRIAVNNICKGIVAVG